MRMLIIGLCYSSLILVAPLASATVYKCKNPDGTYAFQEIPCPDKEGEKVRIWSGPPVEQVAQQSNYYQREKVRLDIKHDFDYAIASHEIRIGMTEDMVIQSWGNPAKINTTIYSGGKSEQWVYRRGKVKSDYVYLQNGIVNSVQTSN